MTGEILFIGHRVPFPPDRGDKIRSNHMLKALARVAPVHVATFADDEADWAHEAELASLAASHCLVRRSKPVPLAGLQALASGKPVSLTAFHHPAIAAYVQQVLANRPIATIFVFSGQMGQYVPADYAGRLVIDFVDADSAKFAAYAQQGRWPRRWIDAREARLLRDEEARLAIRANECLLATRPEADLFRARLTPDELRQSSVQAVCNGIDSAWFDPAVIALEPQIAACLAPRLIFTGQMDYAPNVAAALRGAQRILPLVRRALPQASFHVVGRNPIAELRALDQVDGCFVWGRVADMRCWLKGADVAIAPLEIARGVQNKVLEAMAMGLPAVLSGEAATGIEAENGKHFQIADSDQALADAIIALASQPAKARAMGQAARRHVVETASWSASLAALPALAGFPPLPVADRDAA